MIEKIKAANNPLTIIAIFAALAEVAGTVALGLVDKPLQQTFVWFVMGFPTLLVALFLVTLNFNPKVLYAPSDFKNEENFLSTLIGTHRVSMSLDEVTRQVEEAKSQILSQAVEQVTEAGSAERAKLQNILDRQIRRIEAKIESARQTVQEVASDVNAAVEGQNYVEADILSVIELRKGDPVSATEFDRYMRMGVQPDDTSRALENLINRGFIKKVSVSGEIA
jgi:flagellar biosynthesis GTPase FlhF